LQTLFLSLSHQLGKEIIKHILVEKEALSGEKPSAFLTFLILVEICIPRMALIILIFEITCIPAFGLFGFGATKKRQEGTVPGNTNRTRSVTAIPSHSLPVAPASRSGLSLLGK
jgi:hypothetical protein